MLLSSRSGARFDATLTQRNARVEQAGSSPLSAVMPWLAVERFEYERVEDQRAVVKLLAALDKELGVPVGATLVVRCPGASSAKAPFASRTSLRGPGASRWDSPSGLLWRASFAFSLEVVEYPQAAFSLIADGGLAVALPAPILALPDFGSAKRPLRPRGARVRRHLVAFAAGLAVAAVSGPTVGLAEAHTLKHAALHANATPTLVTSQPGTIAAPSPVSSQTHVDAATATTTVSHSSVAPRLKSTQGSSRKSEPGASQPGTPTTIIITHTTTPAPDAHKPPAAAPPQRQHGHHKHHRHQPSPEAKTHRGHHTRTHDDQSQPATHHHPHHKRHHPSSALPGPASGGVPESPTAVPTPAMPLVPAIAPAPLAPATNTDPDDVTATVDGWSAILGNSSAATWGPNADPFTSALLGQFSSVPGTGDQPPAFLIPIYKAAAKRYQVPWQILAAINWIETDYGANLNISSAGAIGWMQFMPGTWQEYGVAADGHSQPNPFSPQDAIFSAAHYLAANGAAQNLPKAIYAYNHAAWYVVEVLWRAQLITDHVRANTNTSLAGTGQTGLAGAETMLVAAYSAVGGPYSQANHDSFGQTAAELRRAGTDCSGFVSWVLDQVDPRFGNQTTVTLPDQARILAGNGQYVTMWDRPLPGDQGHVIINILGTWFESGGNSAFNAAGGISPMSEAEAAGELSGGGFLPYHLKGM